VARILVAGTTESLGGRALAERIAAAIAADGHDAALLGATPLPEVREADAVVCLLDGPVPPPAAVAAAATAHALGKPALALHTHPLGDAMATLFTQTASVHDEADIGGPLAAFYAHVRPFAGRLVRDQVPRLVREAGHAVRFREAAPDERPRYLKRKIAEEAQELLAATDGGEEREEAADLLEALEALLLARSIGREDLKLVKDAKRKRRGGFERGFVVESTTTADQPGDDVPTWPLEAPMAVPTPAPQPVSQEYVYEVQDGVTNLPPLPGQEPPAARSFADDSSMPLFPSKEAIQAAAPSAPTPPPAQRRSSLWNLGVKGERQAIPDPEPEDPDRIEPAVRDI
jgi:predicted house-cleaning noncanonical NTP pyrophosphatase (MazG superfamily)